MEFSEVTTEKLKEFYMSDEDKLDAAMRSGRIDSIDKLRRFPNLDAGLIRFIIGPINTNTTIKEYIPVDKAICENNRCSVWKRMQSITELPDALKDIPDSNPDDPFSETRMIEECRQECEKCPYNNVQCKSIHINPKQRYKLYNRFRDRLNRPSIRLTKLHIKLLLLFQSWPAELLQKKDKYDCILPDVFIPDLADILKCNSDYLEDCLKDIGNMSIVDLDWVSPHSYNITLPQYYLKFMKASEGGGGYIQIDQKILESLLKEKSIISLRGKLFQLLCNPLTDIYTYQPKIITINELKTVMPKYVNYQAQYQKALNNDLFSMKFDNRLKKIFYKVKDGINNIADLKLNIMKDNIKYLNIAIDKIKPTFITDENTLLQETSFYKDNIIEILKDYKGQIKPDILNKSSLLTFFNDALHISVDYGIANVTKAIHQLERNYRIGSSQIKNAGAKLRMQCCYNMLYGNT